MEILTQHGFVLIAIAVAFGFFMTWGIGANDVANAMGTSVGSKAITVKQAIIIAAVFEFAGAFLAGGHVTKTIRKGIIDPSTISATPTRRPTTRSQTPSRSGTISMSTSGVRSFAPVAMDSVASPARSCSIFSRAVRSNSARRSSTSGKLRT